MFSYSPPRLGRPFIALAAVAGAMAAEITLPPETARYVESPLPGYPTAVAMCSTCHSADYARIQPPTMTRAAWKANVTKMQKTFGAPIADDAIDPIVDYLVKTYGAERAPAAAKSARPPAAAPR